MGKKYYTRGPRKNAIYQGAKPSKFISHSVGAFRLKNLLNKKLFNLFIDLYLNIKKL